MKRQLERARKKFIQMDEDGNGVLNGTELDKLAKWVFDSFHPGGEPLDEATKKEQASSLLKALDKNNDGVLEFEEFAAWFKETCDGIQKFRSGRSKEEREKAAKKVVMTSLKEKNKEKKAKKEVMAAYRAKQAQAKGE